MAMTNVDIKRRAELLAARGYSYREIAQELDVPRMTVYEWLPDKMVLKADDQFVEMAKLRVMGLTNREIGDIMGVHRTRVNAVLGPTPRGADELAERSNWRHLARIAKAMGIRRGKGPSSRSSAVTTLLNAIADGEIDLAWKPGHGPMAPRLRK